jgi:tetratricopeptide (TPR) repeat protein
MRKGCNSVVDNRIVVEDPRPGDLAYTQYLMNGRLSQAGVLNIENNFWDVHPVYPLSTRFGSLIVDYIPYKTEACEIPVEGGMLITRTSTGQAVDTLYAISEETGEIAEIEELYGTANKLFITGEIESSESYYDQLISIDTTLIEKVEAYTKKYEIGKLLVRDQEYFDGLRTTYTSLASSTDDSLMMKIFNQLSTLCLVGQQEYTPAINEFDEIIQQNPNTEEAVFAEIDAVTTGMLIEGSDSTLQKGRLGKYLIKPGSNHFSKLNGILKKNFGTNKEETEEEILPTEYTLYQNYPNPFNPVTTIKYDLPFASDVSLIIYDILGRKVKELVNTKQPAGRYEVQFDASNLASGVYIYQLIADEFISSKKMILLK